MEGNSLVELEVNESIEVEKEKVGLALLKVNNVNDIAIIPEFSKRLKKGGSLIVVSEEEDLGDIVDDIILTGLDFKRLLVNVPTQFERQEDSYSKNKTYISWAVDVSKTNRPSERWVFNKPEGITYHTGAFNHNTFEELLEDLINIHTDENMEIITNDVKVFNTVKTLRENVHLELDKHGLEYAKQVLEPIEIEVKEKINVEVNKVMNVDCFDLLANLEDESIDLVVTDPPYNISVENSKGAYGKGRHGMDFGEWDFGFDTEKWLNYIAPKVKEGGSVLIFNSYKNIGVMAKVMRNYGYELKGIPFWLKTNPIPHLGDRRYVSSMEHAMWFVRTNGKDVKHTFNLHDTSKFENGVFRVSHHDKQNERFHTTQKPVKLFNEIIRIHSNRGDLVLDTFMGSATTAVCAQGLGRDFIGSELDPTYFDLSTKRVVKNKRKPASLWG